MGNMNNPRSKWYIVISIITFLYASFRCAFYRPTADATAISISWNVAVILTMYCGAFGLFFRKSWYAIVLKLGSWIALLQAVHTLYIVFKAINHVPNIFVLLGIFTLMIPLHGWPVILLVWLYKQKSSIIDEDIEDNKDQPDAGVI